MFSKRWLARPHVRLSMGQDNQCKVQSANRVRPGRRSTSRTNGGVSQDKRALSPDEMSAQEGAAAMLFSVPTLWTN